MLQTNLNCLYPQERALVTGLKAANLVVQKLGLGSPAGTQFTCFTSTNTDKAANLVVQKLGLGSPAGTQF